MMVRGVLALVFLAIACDRKALVEQPAAERDTNVFEQLAAEHNTNGAHVEKTLARVSQGAEAARPGHERAHAMVAAVVETPPELPRVQELQVNGRAAFVLHGRGPAKMVFLHGLCGHGMPYLQSFQHTAAERGILIAPQGEIPCGNSPFRAWSADYAAIDRSIQAAFAQAGVSEPLKGVVLIGYSQGASRAEALAKRWPERYSRLVLIGAPHVPTRFNLSRIEAAVMMAGERDRQDLMKFGVRSLRLGKIPSVFMELPEARHGEMGPQAERVMGEALQWLETASE